MKRDRLLDEKLHIVINTRGGFRRIPVDNLDHEQMFISYIKTAWPKTQIKKKTNQGKKPISNEKKSNTQLPETQNNVQRTCSDLMWALNLSPMITISFA
jgi:hypothetical protein